MANDALDLATCDRCDAPISEADYDAGDGLCPACLALHFTCPECGERTERTAAHPDVPNHCRSCGNDIIETRHQEALDKAVDTLRDLVDSIIDAEDLETIEQAVKALKQLAK